MASAIYLYAACAAHLCVDLVPVHAHVIRQLEVFIPADELVAGNEMTGARICPRPAIVKEGECTSPGDVKPFFFRDAHDNVVGDVRPLTPDEYVARYSGHRAQLIGAYPRTDRRGKTGLSLIIEID